MPKDLSGWTQEDLLFFLDAHNFVLHKEKKGSHSVWINLKTEKVVEIHILHGMSFYLEPTLSSYIKNCGFTNKYARDWRKMNKSEQKRIAKENKKNL